MKRASLILSLIILIVGLCIAAEAQSAKQVKAAENKIVLEYEFGVPVVSSSAGYDRVEMKETQAYERTGAPIVPVRPARILIPFGKKAVGSKVTALDTQQMPGTYRLAPAQKPYPLSYTGPRERTNPNPAIYGQANPWPKTDREELAVQSKRGYQVFTVNLFPLQYIPTTGQIFYATKIRLEIDLEDSGSSNAVRPSREVESKLSKMVDNPGAAMETYLPAGSSMQGLDATIEALPSGGPYQCVIITNEALNAAPGPWNFQALRDAKIAKGITATIVTTEWIYANYSGTKPNGQSDNQTRIRNFLIDAYQNWGTQYVLLGGANAIVPARLFWVDSLASYEDYMPVDMYYGCVEPATCTFDYDADNKYGEPNDGVGGADVDLYADIYVGRAPVEDSTELANFVRKTLSYDTAAGDYVYRVAMLGEYLGFGGISQYATAAAEQVRLGGTYDGYFTYGFENHVQSEHFDFNTTGSLPGNPAVRWPLYDSPTYDWSPSELIALMNGGIHIFNHDGHANYVIDMKLHTTDLADLTNTDYFFAYSEGCMPGGFDVPNCFAEVITSMEHGAFAVVMNARYGWGAGDSTDGPSHRYSRQFFDAVLGEQMLEMGRANQDSKEDNASNIGGPCMRWCYYELNLFGDPQQQFKIEQYPLVVTKVDDVADGDGVSPGQQVTYTIGYSYASGTGLTDIPNASIVDDLPDDEIFSNASGGGVYDAGSRTVTWSLGTLHPSDSGARTLTVIVNSPTPGAVISNYCELRSGDQILDRVDENTRVRWPSGSTLYVDASATGANNGTSWPDAFVNLQDAIRQLVNCPPGLSEHVEIWVAAGSYRPDKGISLGLNDTLATFHLIDNVAMYGGFPTGGGQWTDRNPGAHPTILTGDIGVIGDISDNSDHVLTGSRTNATAVLDGFTVTAGYSWYGGGLYNDSGSPTIGHCTFSGNRAELYGGGIFNYRSSPTVTDCAFTGNLAYTYDNEDIPYTCGAGIYNEEGSNPTIARCTFTENLAYSDYASEGYGGGVCNWYDSRPIITDCDFTANRGYGAICNFGSSDAVIANCTFTGHTYGAMHNELSAPLVSNSVFVGNSNYFSGGAMQNSGRSSPSNLGPTVANCVFCGNSTSSAGGALSGGDETIVVNCTFFGNTSPTNGGAIGAGNPTLTNCILWGNTAPTGPQIYSGAYTPLVTYCDVQGGWTGTGNINTNPLFVDANGADNVVGTLDDNLQLPSNSPCNDAGKNSAVPVGVTTDVAGNPRFCDAPVADTGSGTPPIVDMGAYEYFFASGPAASNPTPSNGATNVGVTTDLTWIAGAGATSHDVYFGTVNPPPFIRNQAATTYDTGTMNTNTTYYWRIDEHNAGGTTVGTVWSFTTAPPAPGAATTPNPANGAANVGLTQDVSWTAGSGATSHDVYFGAVNPPPFIANQTAATYDTGTMTAGMTYYWRIDEKNAGGTTASAVWSFTTVNPPPAVGILGAWVTGTTHAKESGNNRGLIFIAHGERSTVNPSLTAVTYGGQAMTKVVERLQTSGTSSRAYVVAFYLNEAGIAAATNTTFVPTWTNVPSPVEYRSVFLGNVDQTTPIGATANNGSTSGVTLATSALSTALGDMVIEGSANSNAGTYTANNGFAKDYDSSNTSYDAMDGHKAATGAAETPSVTHTVSSSRKALIGFVVQVAQPVSPPSAASNPSPANGATGVSIDTDLVWTAGSGATSHDVYFGTANPPPFVGNRAGTTFDAGIMSATATYYWRIDEKNAGGTTAGTIWSFTTASPPPPPGAASSPNPASGAVDVATDADLSWTAGSGATSHDVCFGTVNPPPFIGNQSGATFDTGTMSASTTYYWRIDEKNAGGTTTGAVWSFTTTAASGPVVLLQDGFEANFDKWTDGGTTDWDRATAQKYAGSYSAHAGSSDNDLFSDNMDTTGKSSIRIEFWYRDDDIDDSDDIYLQLYNGSAYANKFELGNSTEDTWNKCDITINNSGGDVQYFRSNFRIKFEGTSIDSGENLWIDDVTVTAQ